MPNTRKYRRHCELYVRNRQRRIKVDSAKLQSFARGIFDALIDHHRGPHTTQFTRALHEVTFYLVSDRRMSQLHAEFSGVPGPTDILTFHHGEVFISVDTAERQAAEFGNSLDRELRIYIVHGLLHLHGHDDHTSAEAAEMHRLQELLVS
jgi:probable rRNA maturation factor